MSCRRLLRPILLTVLIAVPGAAQDPGGILPGYVQVGDMILRADALGEDSAYAWVPWPYGVVPYSFNANVNSFNQGRARRAMDEISAASGVVFIARSVQSDYIEFLDSNENSSYIGMVGGRQFVRMTDWGAKFVIVHELMHAVGFVHEHTRFDASNYITINWQNVQGSQASNFMLSIFSTVLTPYDFLSLMHYGRTAWSSNGLDTITCKPGYESWQNRIGNSSFMSLLDAQGLQTRYGTSNAYPAIASISPQTVLSGGSTPLTLHVYGSDFVEGSLTGEGVRGTTIRHDGIDLPTQFMDSGHLTAVITPAMRSHPGTSQITVYNPAPGTNLPSAPRTLTVNCDPTALAISGGGPSTITNGCQSFVISPVYNAFNVVAVSSMADWDIQMGSASAAAGGGVCDFVAGSGFFGGGTVAPDTGNLSLYSWWTTAPATLEHVVSTPMQQGQPTIATIDAGSVARAFHYNPGAVGYYTLQVAGPPDLHWKLLFGGNTFEWRSSTTHAVASGDVGGGPVSGIVMGPAPWCLVVYRNGGPVTASASFTVSLCHDLTPVNLVSGTSIHTAAAGACVPFTISPLANAWNAVGVSSASDWDIQMGPAASQAGGSACDYVLADGNAGPVSPVAGIASAFTWPGAAGSLQFGPDQYTFNMPATVSLGVNLIGVYEFRVVNPGNYDVAVTAPGFSWDVHRPGASPAWRRAADRDFGPFGATGGNATLTNLGPGWHAIVIYRNGGASALTAANISVAPTTPPPGLTALAPAVAPAGSPSLLLSAQGSGFAATSVIRWNGANLATTFLSASELRATVHSSLLASPGAAAVSVFTPGAGVSATLTFTVGNPVPVLAGLSSTYAVAGSTPLTLLVQGSAFVPSSQVLWAGIPLPTTYVSSTSLSAYLDSTKLTMPGFWPVAVENPAPGGGTSTPIAFQVIAPAITQIAPAASPILAPGAPAFTLAVQGAFFHPWSLVHANQVPLPTTYVGPGSLSAILDPALFVQSGRPGALAIAVSNSSEAISNLVPHVFGGGNDAGLSRTHPLAPFPGTPFSLRVEGAITGAPVTLIADAGAPVPVAGWPTPAAGLVLGVTEMAGSNGLWLPLRDGIGIFGPPDGTLIGLNAALNLQGFVMPSPPANVQVTLQAAYLDPSTPLGFQLTWPLHTLGI